MPDPDTDRGEPFGLTEAQRIAIVTHERATAITGLQKVAEQQNENIGLLTTSVTALAKAIESRPTRRETLGMVGVMQIATLLLVCVLFIFVIRGQALINDCVNQTGKCYKDQSSRTGNAVQGINLTSILTAQCSLDGANPVEPCVKEALKKRAAEAPVTGGN